MSVVVSNVSKIYGDQKAVDHLSFEAKKGEILGFLGPNGAGKSTTMKMITGYLTPTEGEIWVEGIPVNSEALEVKKKIGYLSESNPLYYDMYVKEYLHFVSKIHKIGNTEKSINDVIGITGLGKEKHKLIGTLSKGYKQRVGLAQALLHNPSVLILDEPTSGLDMNQLEDIRTLIKKLGEEKTVIFSTHIMQEVQTLCDRVIILNEGKLVANDPIQILQSKIAGSKAVYIEIESLIAFQALFSKLPGIEKTEKINDLPNGLSAYRIFYPGNLDIRKTIFQHCAANDVILYAMYEEKLNVESIFRKLTKSNPEA